MSINNSSKKYLRKKGVADRYGVSERTIDRWIDLGRLPSPVYLPGNRIPMFAEDGLDENERRATSRLREPLADTWQPIGDVAKRVIEKIGGGEQ